MPNRTLIHLSHFALCLIALFLCGCASRPAAEDSSRPLITEALSEYRHFPDQPNVVAVSRGGRIFVSFPGWDKRPLHSLVEVLADGTLTPYPDADWNRWGDDVAAKPEAHFICVQGITFDSDGFLWVLDQASPTLASGGAKLVKIDPATNQVKQVIVFDESVAARDSYLHDVHIDPLGSYAFIADSGAGGIIVVNLVSGISRRLMQGDPSTRAEHGYVPKIMDRELRDENGRPLQIHTHGLAIDTKGDYLYYHALTARTLYRIGVSFLEDERLTAAQLAGHIEKLTVTGAVDGMLMDSSGNLYLTALEDSTIKRYRPKENRLETIVRDQRIQWPGSMAIGPGDYLYFTDSQINRMPRFNNGKDRRVLPYKLFRICLSSFR